MAMGWDVGCGVFSGKELAGHNCTGRRRFLRGGKDQLVIFPGFELQI